MEPKHKIWTHRATEAKESRVETRGISTLRGKDHSGPRKAVSEEWGVRMWIPGKRLFHTSHILLHFLGSWRNHQRKTEHIRVKTDTKEDSVIREGQVLSKAGCVWRGCSGFLTWFSFLLTSVTYLSTIPLPLQVQDYTVMNLGQVGMADPDMAAFRFLLFQLSAASKRHRIQLSVAVFHTVTVGM